jgi:hypothetical protein
MSPLPPKARRIGAQAGVGFGKRAKRQLDHVDVLLSQLPSMTEAQPKEGKSLEPQT